MTEIKLLVVIKLKQQQYNDNIRAIVLYYDYSLVNYKLRAMSVKHNTQMQQLHNLSIAKNIKQVNINAIIKIIQQLQTNFTLSQKSIIIQQLSALYLKLTLHFSHKLTLYNNSLLFETSRKVKKGGNTTTTKKNRIVHKQVNTPTKEINLRELLAQSLSSVKNTHSSVVNSNDKSALDKPLPETLSMQMPNQTIMEYHAIDRDIENIGRDVESIDLEAKHEEQLEIYKKMFINTNQPIKSTKKHRSKTKTKTNKKSYILMDEQINIKTNHKDIYHEIQHILTNIKHRTQYEKTQLAKFMNIMDRKSIVAVNYENQYYHNIDQIKLLNKDINHHYRRQSDFTDNNQESYNTMFLDEINQQKQEKVVKSDKKMDEDVDTMVNLIRNKIESQGQVQLNKLFNSKKCTKEVKSKVFYDILSSGYKLHQFNTNKFGEIKVMNIV